MTSERAVDGWEELRREIEALPVPWLVVDKPSYVHGWKSAMTRVLAVVVRLSAARGEPPEPGPAIDVERLAARAFHWQHTGSGDICGDCSHHAHLFAEFLARETT